MRFPCSAAGKPFLPLTLTLGAQTVSTEGLADSGSDVNVLPWNIGNALAKVADFAPVRLAFAWCRTDEVPLVLGQTNFFMEFAVCFFRSQAEFSVVPKAAGSAEE